MTAATPTRNVRIPAQRTNSRPASWALVERAQAGDREAFGDLYRQYRGTVYRYAQHRLPSQAEDITSATFLRGLGSIGQVAWQGRDIGAWLVTIARNLIVDYYKSHRVRREFALGDSREMDEAVERWADDPHVEAERVELRRVLVDAIDLLTRDQAAVVQLRYLVGLTTRETAQRMGINEGAVKARLMRAIGALRRSDVLKDYQ